jgi:hypothetical protein
MIAEDLATDGVSANEVELVAVSNHAWLRRLRRLDTVSWGGAAGLGCSRCGAAANDTDEDVHQFLQACAVGVDRWIPSVTT